MPQSPEYSASIVTIMNSGIGFIAGSLFTLFVNHRYNEYRDNKIMKQNLQIKITEDLIPKVTAFYKASIKFINFDIILVELIIPDYNLKLMHYDLDNEVIRELEIFDPVVTAEKILRIENELKRMNTEFNHFTNEIKEILIDLISLIETRSYVFDHFKTTLTDLKTLLSHFNFRSILVNTCFHEILYLVEKSKPVDDVKVKELTEQFEISKQLIKDNIAVLDNLRDIIQLELYGHLFENPIDIGSIYKGVNI